MPRDVIASAFAAFDARHAGVEMLRLVHDTRETSIAGSVDGGHVLRFGNGTATVVANVTLKDDRLKVTVTVPESDGLTLSIEELATSLRLVRRGSMPAVFDEVHRGFVSITGSRPGSSAQEWCTPWMRM